MTFKLTNLAKRILLMPTNSDISGLKLIYDDTILKAWCCRDIYISSTPAFSYGGTTTLTIASTEPLASSATQSYPVLFPFNSQYYGYYPDINTDDFDNMLYTSYWISSACIGRPDLEDSKLTFNNEIIKQLGTTTTSEITVNITNSDSSNYTIDTLGLVSCSMGGLAGYVSNADGQTSGGYAIDHSRILIGTESIPPTVIAPGETYNFTLKLDLPYPYVSTT